MTSLGPYASFIVTSYALVTAVVLILIVWITLDYRNQRRRLRELDESGVTQALRTQPRGLAMRDLR